MLAKGAPGNSHNEFGNSNAGKSGDFQSSHSDNDSSELASVEDSAVVLGLVLH
jgi:hypothetical protein